MCTVIKHGLRIGSAQSMFHIILCAEQAINRFRDCFWIIPPCSQWPIWYLINWWCCIVENRQMTFWEKELWRKKHIDVPQDPNWPQCISATLGLHTVVVLRSINQYSRKDTVCFILKWSVLRPPLKRGTVGLNFPWTVISMMLSTVKAFDLRSWL